MLRRVPKKASAPPQAGFVADVARARPKPTDMWTVKASHEWQAQRKKCEEEARAAKKAKQPTPNTQAPFLFKPTPGQAPPQVAAFGSEHDLKHWCYQWASENQILPTFNPGLRSVTVHGRRVQVPRFRSITG